MTEKRLHPYQAEIIAEFHRTAAEFKRILMVSPTGSGKTFIATSIAEGYVSRGKTVLFLVHRRELVFQAVAELEAAGLQCGVIMAGEIPTPMAPVQVSMVQTLHTRAIQSERMKLPDADLLVVDECHHAAALSWRSIIESYPDAHVLGLTATPVRGDGKGLGGIYEVMLECPQVAELIKMGFLVGSKVYAPADPDLSGVKVRQGDYALNELETRMNTSGLVADIVSTYLKYGEDRKAVVFCVGVGHSLHVRDQFIEAGIKAEHIDGDTPKDERDATRDRLASGEIQVVTNCMVWTEGFNLPELGCIILARPTRQLGLYKQMLGRGQRTALGKKDMIVLDHSGAVFRHGLPEDPVVWTLSEDKTARNPKHEARKSEMFGGPAFIDCAQCATLRERGKACPNCGFLPQRKPKPFVCEEGELALVQGGKPGKVEVDKQQWYNELAGYAQERGRKPGYAYYKFQEKFGHPPPRWMRPQPCSPSPEVRSWCRSRDIAYAKAMEAKKAQGWQ